MKKIAFAVILSLMLQSIPALASSTPPPPPTPVPGTGGTSIAIILGLGALALAVLDGAGASAKATGTEFEKLNNNPAFPTLLKQMAGGSLNTVEILK